MLADDTPHVVVVGAGFGGLTVARRLARGARRQPLRVTLVDRRNHHTFQPLLYQVATAGLQPQDVGHPLRPVFGLKSLAESLALRDHVLRQFEHAAVHPEEDDGHLTFVIAGGGPTGVELAGAMAELVTDVLRRDHPGLDMGRVRIVLVEMADRLLGGFPAWVAWLGLHLLFLVGFRNRVAVFLSWVWNYLTYDRAARLILHADAERPSAAPLDLDDTA